MAEVAASPRGEVLLARPSSSMVTGRGITTVHRPLGLRSQLTSAFARRLRGRRDDVVDGREVGLYGGGEYRHDMWGIASSSRRRGRGGERRRRQRKREGEAGYAGQTRQRLRKIVRLTLCAGEARPVWVRASVSPGGQVE